MVKNYCSNSHQTVEMQTLSLGYLINATKFFLKNITSTLKYLPYSAHCRIRRIVIRRIVVSADYYSADCRSADCRRGINDSADCRSADCRNTLSVISGLVISKKMAI